MDGPQWSLEISEGACNGWEAKKVHTVGAPDVVPIDFSYEHTPHSMI